MKTLLRRRDTCGTDHMFPVLLREELRKQCAPQTLLRLFDIERAAECASADAAFGLSIAAEAAGGNSFDGELAVQDENGVTQFGELRSAILKAPHRLVFFACDLLHLSSCHPYRVDVELFPSTPPPAMMRKH